MGRGPVRWIAIALVGALVATLAVSLVSGTGDVAGDDAVGRTSGEGPRTASSEALDGPHLWLDLCTGASCPALDDASRDALVAELEDDPRVASTLFVSSDQAYQLFLDRFGDQEELVEAVRREDVPARIEVDLLDPGETPAVLADYANRDGVAAANDARRVQP